MKNIFMSAGAKRAVFISALAVGSLAFWSSGAVAQCVNNDKVNANYDEIPSNPEDFDALKTQMKNRFGLEYGLSCEGRTLYAEQEPINVPPSDPNYPKQLTLAYDRAMMRMMAKQILLKYGTQVTQRVMSVMQDDSSNPMKWDDVKNQMKSGSGDVNKAEIILDKFLNVVEGRLDAELEKLGVPAEEVRRSSISQKKQLFKNNFRKETLQKAVGDMRGVVPVATHVFTVTRGGKQSAQLGVIAIESNNTRQFANDISRKRESAFRGTPNSLAQILPTKKEDYLNEIGLRFVYDEKGAPMLISYGRWAVTAKSDNAARFEQYVIQAKESAFDMATTYVNEFASSSFVVDEKQVVESISETIAERISEFENKKLLGQDEFVREIEEVGLKKFKESKSTSKMSLRGVAEIRKWEFEDPVTKILHVGAVAVWSPQILANQNEAVRQISSGGRSPEPKAPDASVQENRVSRPVNRANDF